MFRIRIVVENKIGKTPRRRVKGNLLGEFLSHYSNTIYTSAIPHLSITIPRRCNLCIFLPEVNRKLDFPGHGIPVMRLNISFKFGYPTHIDNSHSKLFLSDNNQTEPKLRIGILKITSN